MPGTVSYNPKIVSSNLIAFWDMANMKSMPNTHPNVTNLSWVNSMVPDPITGTKLGLQFQTHKKPDGTDYFTYSKDFGGFIQFTRCTVANKEGSGAHSLTLAGTALEVNKFLYNDHSCEIWFRMDDIRSANEAHSNLANYNSSENQSALFSYNGFHAGWNYNTTDGLYWDVWHNSTNGNLFCLFSLSNTEDQTKNIHRGKWYQAVIVRANNVWQGYINGNPIGANVISIPNNGGATGNFLHMGVMGFNPANTLSNRWHGNNSVALIRMYNKGLTEEEVRQNFNANRGRFSI